MIAPLFVIFEFHAPFSMKSIINNKIAILKNVLHLNLILSKNPFQFLNILKTS
ncbi:hypothetical protein THIOM_004049 [Candidatus Thiomargarita nelsonii]|uniref:Uncharacterized protein n=1 Tax=Candidatus Thiomargarita nelsonii TaxID=1003181 RepID=A0A176RX18_9GAMM|nr:hypothetical protein THIOM_004049 [Candidatus Thiomargarita nelsonii]